MCTESSVISPDFSWIQKVTYLRKWWRSPPLPSGTGFFCILSFKSGQRSILFAFFFFFLLKTLDQYFVRPPQTWSCVRPTAVIMLGGFRGNISRCLATFFRSKIEIRLLPVRSLWFYLMISFQVSGLCCFRIFRCSCGSRFSFSQKLFPCLRLSCAFSSTQPRSEAAICLCTSHLHKARSLSCPWENVTPWSSMVFF